MHPAQASTSVIYRADVVAFIAPRFSLELDPAEVGPQNDRGHWPQAKAVFTRVFKTKTRAQWCELLEGTDVCFAPVLSFAEAPEHPHMKARGSFVEVDGLVQPAPAVRFSATPSAKPQAPRPPKDIGALTNWLAPERRAHWQSTLGENASTAQ